MKWQRVEPPSRPHSPIAKPTSRLTGDALRKSLFVGRRHPFLACSFPSAFNLGQPPRRVMRRESSQPPSSQDIFLRRLFSQLIAAQPRERPEPHQRDECVLFNCGGRLTSLRADTMEPNRSARPCLDRGVQAPFASDLCYDFMPLGPLLLPSRKSIITLEPTADVACHQVARRFRRIVHRDGQEQASKTSCFMD